jgi:hypothetical protein
MSMNQLDKSSVFSYATLLLEPYQGFAIVSDVGAPLPALSTNTLISQNAFVISFRKSTPPQNRQLNVDYY